MILSLGINIIDITYFNRTKWHRYRICVFDRTFAAQFVFFAARLPHNLRFSPHFRRTFWTFSPHLHRTIWSYCQVRCRTIWQKLSHLNLAPDNSWYYITSPPPLYSYIIDIIFILLIIIHRIYINFGRLGIKCKAIPIII